MPRNRNFREDRDWSDYQHPSMTYQPPKLLRQFRAGAALIVSTVLVVGLWSLAWYGASRYVKSQVVNWVEAQKAQGADAGFTTLEVSGFPNKIVLNINKPHYTGPVGGQAVTWNGEALTLNTRPWSPWRLHAEIPGRHALTFSDAGLALKGDVARLSADIVLASPWPEQLTVQMEGLNLRGDAVVMADTLRVDVQYDASAKTGGTGFMLDVAGTNWTLPLQGGWGLGDTIENVEATVKVLGPVQSGPVAERLSAWRDVGGAVQVERLKLRHGPLALASAGTITLDDTLQPIASFSAKFEGLFQVLEILRKRGVVKGGDAVFATMALSALSKRPAGGGPSTINLAVNVQDQQLLLGPIPLLALPAIEWGEAAQPEVLPSALPADTPAARDYKSGPTIY